MNDINVELLKDDKARIKENKHLDYLARKNKYNIEVELQKRLDYINIDSKPKPKTKKETAHDYYLLKKDIKQVYKKQYDIENKEKNSDYARQYYQSNLEKLKAYSRVYYLANREKIYKYNKQYVLDNQERLHDYRIEYYDKHKR